MEAALEKSRAREKEVSALLSLTRSVLEQTDFESTARNIFDQCSRLLQATSGYVALLSENGSENELLFLEDGGLECRVDPELPMPIRGLRALAYETDQAVYDNDFMNSEHARYMPEGHMPLENVLFAPLVISGRTVGVIGQANKHGGFDDNDAALAAGFAEIAAIALEKA